MELASHTQSHDTRNETEETISPIDAEMNNTRQEVQSELIRGSDTSEQEKRNPPRKASYWNRLCLDTWWSEILAIIFSLACFIAIVAVLSSFDGKQSPQLAYGLTLNTIVSILATACKSSLLFLVAESIGQLKWVWFFQQGKDAKKRPLLDIQSFDGASRGPLGSLTILFRQKGLSLASLGAAITLLLLAFDPFIQQIIDYPLREIKSNSDFAVAKQAVGFGRAYHTFSHSQIRNSVNTGIWTDNFETNPICPSGNCIWPSFDSVGWCSQCEDVTASAVLVGCDNATIYINDNNTTQHTSCNITLPLGKPGVLQMAVDPPVDPKRYSNRIHVPKDIIWTVSDHISRDRHSYAGVENPQFVIAHAELALPDDIVDSLFHITQISLSGVKKATQCAVTACSRTYNVSISNGATMVHTSAPNFGESFGSFDFECWKKDKGAPTNLEEPRYDMVADTAAMASCGWDMVWRSGFPKELTGLFYHDMNYFHDNTDYRVSNNPEADTDNVQEIVSTSLDQVTTRIANSLTKLALDKSNMTITGTMSHTKTFVAVKWKWITLPAVVVLLSLLFLLTTILINSRQKRLALWKSSVLPLLYHGIDHERVSIPDGENVAVVSAMEADAKGTEVRIEESERGRLLFR